jgi:hypothetical protein
MILVKGWHELFELHSYRCNIAQQIADAKASPTQAPWRVLLDTPEMAYYILQLHTL